MLGGLPRVPRPLFSPQMLVLVCQRTRLTGSSIPTLSGFWQQTNNPQTQIRVKEEFPACFLPFFSLFFPSVPRSYRSKPCLYFRLRIPQAGINDLNQGQNQIPGCCSTFCSSYPVERRAVGWRLLPARNLSAWLAGWAPGRPRGLHTGCDLAASCVAAAAALT